MTIEKEDLAQLRKELSSDMSDAIEKSIKTVLQIERAWMEERIRQIVKEERCNCPFSPCQREVIPQFFSMVGDFGGGDYREGILQIRKNHTWTSNTRRKADKYATGVTIAAISTVVVAAVAALLALIGFEK